MQEFYAISELLALLVLEPRTGLLIALLAIGACIDIRTYRIPNWLTFGGTAFALVYSVAVPFSPGHGFLWAIGGLTAGLFIMLPLYAMRVMGAGDVKLMAMAGAFLGTTDVFSAAVSTFIAGGVAAILFAVHRRVFRQMMGNIRTTAEMMIVSAATGVGAGSIDARKKSVGKLPYGVSIFVGTAGYVVARHFGFI